MPYWGQFYSGETSGTTSASGSNYSYSSNSTAATSTGLWASGWTLSPLTEHPPRPELTEEQRQAQRLQEEERSRREVLEERERARAVKMAEDLLRDHLGDACLEEFKTTGQISVDSPGRPGRRYSVDARSRIRVFEGDRLVDELCVHLVSPDGLGDCSWLPAADVVLGKVWLLLHDEDRLLRGANHNPIPR